jgi:hypothetical protein
MVQCPQCGSTYEIQDLSFSNPECPSCGYTPPLDSNQSYPLAIQRLSDILGVKGRTVRWKFPLILYLGLISTLLVTVVLRLFGLPLPFTFPVIVNLLIDALLLIGAIVSTLIFLKSKNVFVVALTGSGIYMVASFFFNIVFRAPNMVSVFTSLIFSFLLFYGFLLFLSKIKYEWLALGLSLFIAYIGIAIFDIIYISIDISYFIGIKIISEFLLVYSLKASFFGLVLWLFYEQLALVKFTPVSIAAKGEPSVMAVKGKPGEKDQGFFAPERKGLQKGMLGGLAMMAIAAIWFFGGLAAGYIFYYPPILFLIGLWGFFKGLLTGNVTGGRSTSRTQPDVEEKQK